MAELSTGMFSHIFLDLLPVILIVSNLLAGRAHWKKPLKLFDSAKSRLQLRYSIG